MKTPLRTLDWSDEGSRTCRVVCIRTVSQLTIRTDVRITVTSYSVVIQHKVFTGVCMPFSMEQHFLSVGLRADPSDPGPDRREFVRGTRWIDRLSNMTVVAAAWGAYSDGG